MPDYRRISTKQISAPIAPGSSGGPLVFVETGEVIAINSARYNGEIIGSSIPISNIWSIVNNWSQEAKHVQGGTSPSVNHNSSWLMRKKRLILCIIFMRILMMATL